MAGEDLLGQRHRALLGLDRWQKHFLLHARDIERKQAAVFDHLPGNFVFTFGKFAERDLVSRPNTVDQRKVGGG